MSPPPPQTALLCVSKALFTLSVPARCHLLQKAPWGRPRVSPPALGDTPGGPWWTVVTVCPLLPGCAAPWECPGPSRSRVQGWAVTAGQPTGTGACVGDTEAVSFLSDRVRASVTCFQQAAKGRTLPAQWMR